MFTPSSVQINSHIWCVNSTAVTLLNALKQWSNRVLELFNSSKQSVEHEGFISFECHHGPEECNGNEIHSCALSEATNNQTAAIEFVGCQMYTKSKGTSAVNYLIPICIIIIFIDRIMESKLFCNVIWIYE